MPSHTPERTCVACRKKGAKGELIRLVNTQDGVIIDYNEKLPGRGAYVCFETACIEKGLRKEMLSRAFKEQAGALEISGFYEQLSASILRKIDSLLGMARKSGQVAMGFDPALDATFKHQAGLLIIAEDVSGNTMDKFKEKNGRAVSEAVRFLTKDELGQLLGVSPVGVIYIHGDALALGLRKEFGRLEKLRGVRV